MRCTDYALLLVYALFVAILFGFPHIYLYALKLGRALESGEHVRKAALAFAWRMLVALVLSVVALLLLGLAPTTLC